MSLKKFLKNNVLPAAAVVIALTVMSFKLIGNSENETKSTAASNAEATLVDYKWFEIDPGYSLTSPVPQAKAHYLGTGPTAPSGDCDGGSKQCISGFNASQVNSSNQLKDNSQIPVMTPGTRP